jgi:hypothetical protein
MCKVQERGAYIEVPAQLQVQVVSNGGLPSAISTTRSPRSSHLRIVVILFTKCLDNANMIESVLTSDRASHLEDTGFAEVESTLAIEKWSGGIVRRIR